MPQPVPPAVTPAPPADIASIPDAVPRPEPRSARGNPPFYEVAGRRYTVLARSDNHIERGVASWYGPTFHGKSTSSGEPYDMYAMTAAHKTLPLPCYARVTNLANGRSVIVRINDRGPFVDNRIIDLSYTAAARLDMLRNGTAFVEVATITPGGNATGGFIATAQAQAAPPPADAPASARAPAESGLYIQIGAFGDEANAQRVLARLQAAGIDRILSTATTINGQNLRRIRVGPVGSVAEFDQLASRLETLGFADARLALD
jgi:rare lipoprotein A